MNANLLEHERVEAWKAEHPREWWAFCELKDTDQLRDRVLIAILNNQDEDESIDELVSFAESLEAYRRAHKAGVVKPPPKVGERRSFPIVVRNMRRMEEGNRRFFRVVFACPDGWGGYFDTTNPGVVERISRLRNLTQPLTVVGEISRQPYGFYVELEGNVRIV